MEDYYRQRLTPREQDPTELLLTNEKEAWGRFQWIDGLVKRYPSYTHDDIFYLEYDFAMMLLEGIRIDIDYNRKYERAQKQVRR